MNCVKMEFCSCRKLILFIIREGTRQRPAPVGGVHEKNPSVSQTKPKYLNKELQSMEGSGGSGNPTDHAPAPSKLHHSLFDANWASHNM
jgi:hypothetical protein